MHFTNPLHETTRRVMLPEAWVKSAHDVQVNYYNYLHVRLIPSTDVYIGARLVYRVNAIGCRGDDLLVGKPIIAFFGDQFIHGDLDGSLCDIVTVEPFQVVNCGVEDMVLADVVARVIEVNEAAPVSCAVIAPPRKGLAPIPARYFVGPPSPYSPWQEALDRLPTGPTYVMLMPPDIASWPDQPLARRYVAFLRAYCAEKAITVLDAPQPLPAPRLSLKERLACVFGKPPPPADVPSISAFLQEQIASLTATLAPVQGHDAPTLPPTNQPGAHGPDDVGKNYPLW